MTDNKSFYTKKDIENFVLQKSQYEVKIYSSVRQMGESENLLDDGNSYENIFEFTDHMYNVENYLCYFIRKEEYRDNEFGTNLVFIEYNQEDLPISCYLENPWGKMGGEICDMVSATMDCLLDKSKK